MQLKQVHTLDALRSVRDFLDRNELTVRLGPLTPHVATLTSAIDQLEAMVVEQQSRTNLSRAGTTRRNEIARSVLLELMRPVARMAPALFPHDVALRQALAMPRRRQASVVIAAAIAMADNAEPHAKAYIAAGFAPDFLELLRAGAAELKAATDTRTKDLGRRAASTTGTRDAVRHARRVVRMIDAMLSPALEKDRPRLSEWRTLYRQVRRRAPVVVKEGGAVAGTTPPADGAPVVEVPVLKAA